MRYVILTIWLIFSASVKADDSCFYPSKKDQGDILKFDNCGSIEGDKVNLGKDHLDNLSFDQDGLVCLIFFRDDVFYFHKNGQSQRVLFFDNGCDYFKEGLARGMVNDQMVFINRLLKVVLNPGFELLSHYDYGHSVVCNGPFREETRGEHTLSKGGKCGLLNKQGRLVVEAKYKIEDRDVFRNYINSNNHCPAPPVTTEKSALCHARRHVSNMDFHTSQWKKHEISKQDNIWLITFVEDNGADEEFTLDINYSNAQWNYITQESHNKALQRTMR